MLNSSSLVVLGALFHFSGDRPSTIGVKDYGGGLKGLSLCPKTNNCVSTSEGANDQSHYVPAWQYNPEDGRGMRKPASREQAMAELVDVIKTTKPDNFTPTIVKQTEDYVYVEYESPTFGFVDDVEFWFPSDKCALHKCGIFKCAPETSSCQMKSASVNFVVMSGGCVLRQQQ